MEDRDLILATLIATVQNLDIDIQILESARMRYEQAERHEAAWERQTDEMIRLLEKISGMPG
jgi:Tfp pilus assembly protein PilN